MERTLKQITRDEFMKKPGRIHSFLSKNYVWHLYLYSSMERSYMKKTKNLDGKTIKNWHKIKESTVIKHIREFF